MTLPEPRSSEVPTLRLSNGSPDAIRDPVFLLSLPHSLSSFLCAMLGQHPQMNALPETNLFLADTLSDWWDVCTNSSFSIAAGLLRAVAQLYFGEQTETTVQLAEAWLRRRLPFTTGYLIELLGEKVRPRMIVEKSPSIVSDIDSMRRAQLMFPQARFIHAIQHPQAHCKAVLAAVENARANQCQIPQWLLQLAGFSAASADELLQAEPELNPQQSWHTLNTNICEFLAGVPTDQKLRVRTEELLTCQQFTLRMIAEWLGLQASGEAIQLMSHPERSPYACIGPVGARFGDNPLFLRTPSLSAVPADHGKLDTPREAGGLSSEVKTLARQFGYE